MGEGGCARVWLGTGLTTQAIEIDRGSESDTEIKIKRERERESTTERPRLPLRQHEACLGKHAGKGRGQLAGTLKREGTGCGGAVIMYSCGAQLQGARQETGRRHPRTCSRQSSPRRRRT